jgi:hypothetical protein
MQGTVYTIVTIAPNLSREGREGPESAPGPSPSRSSPVRTIPQQAACQVERDGKSPSPRTLVPSTTVPPAHSTAFVEEQARIRVDLVRGRSDGGRRDATPSARRGDGGLTGGGVGRDGRRSRGGVDAAAAGVAVARCSADAAERGTTADDARVVAHRWRGRGWPGELVGDCAVE